MTRRKQVGQGDHLSPEGMVEDEKLGQILRHSDTKDGKFSLT